MSLKHEHRLILTVVICMAILAVWETFVMPTPKPRPKEPQKAAQFEPEGAAKAAPSTPTTTAPGTAAASAMPAPEGPATPVLAAIPVRTLRLDSPDARTTLSNRGAMAVAWEFPAFHSYHEGATGAAKAPVDLAKEVAAGPGEGIFATGFTVGGETVPTTALWNIAAQSASGVTFEYRTPGGVRLRKSIVGAGAGYRGQLVIEAANETGGDTEISISLSFPVGESASAPKGSLFGPPPMPPHFAAYGAGELHQYNPEGLEKTETVPVAPVWAGINLHHFVAAVVLPPGMEARATATKAGERKIMGALLLPPQRVAAGKSLRIELPWYAGPKFGNNLKALGVGLEAALDWGFFGVLVRPLLWLLRWFNEIAGNWGIAIILLTFVVKLVTLPLTLKSSREMKRAADDMKRLQPKLEALKAKYGNDRTRLNEEQMKMYQQEGVNPLAMLGGCFPMLVQMPVWFALYRMLYTAVELYQAPFIPGWIDDLNRADPYYITPVVLGGLTFVQQKMTPQAVDNAQAKMMLYFMPVFLFVIMMSLPAGLTVYMVANAVLSIFQQLYINRTMPPPAPKRA